MSFPPGQGLSSAELAHIFASNPFPFLRECKEKFGAIFTRTWATSA